MTHAWMKITNGRCGPDDGGTHNLQLVANMLCEIVGFEPPYPHVFEDEGVSLEEASSVRFVSLEEDEDVPLEEMASSRGNDQHTSEGKSPSLLSRLRRRVLREVLASKQSDMHNRSSGDWRTTERVARRQLVLERAFPSC